MRYALYLDWNLNLLPKALPAKGPVSFEATSYKAFTCAL